MQQFAGYVPPGFRTYLSTRGWYTTIGTLRDPRYPDHAEATEALREAIVREINGNADVRAMNLRTRRATASGRTASGRTSSIRRSTRTPRSTTAIRKPASRAAAGGSAPAAAAIPAAKAAARRWNRPFSMNAWPQVTFFSGGTEAPDETAQGEWLNLVAKAGFSYLMASVKYLRDGDYTVAAHRGRRAARRGVADDRCEFARSCPAVRRRTRQTSTTAAK